MADSLIIGYGIVFDEADRVLLLRRRADQELWPSQWWLPGDVTPLSEEPDDTVPRLFAHLLRQRVRAAYAHTVSATEPSGGRFVVHNAYLVTVEESLDAAPADETNPFDAMEWWDPSAALSELPDQQAELLATVVERRASGWDFGSNETLDQLFDAGQPTQTNESQDVPRRPHIERRNAGAQILADLTGQTGFAQAIESRMGPFGSYLIDHIWGDIWQDGLLSRRDRSLAALAASGALMQVDGFAFNAAIGLENGLKPHEIVEVGVQLAVECGFPFANLVLTRVLSDWSQSDHSYEPQPAIAKDDDQRRRDAASVSLVLTKQQSNPDTIADDAQRQLGSIGRLTVDWAWGDIWQRPELTQRDRALVVFAIHLASGRDRELQSDLEVAHRLGCSWDELDGVIAIASAFCGLPRATDAGRILQRIRSRTSLPSMSPND